MLSSLCLGAAVSVSAVPVASSTSTARHSHLKNCAKETINVAEEEGVIVEAAIIDLRDAFRNIDVHPSEWGFLAGEFMARALMGASPKAFETIVLGLLGTDFARLDDSWCAPGLVALRTLRG